MKSIKCHKCFYRIEIEDEYYQDLLDKNNGIGEITCPHCKTVIPLIEKNSKESKQKITSPLVRPLPKSHKTSWVLSWLKYIRNAHTVFAMGGILVIFVGILNLIPGEGLFTILIGLSVFGESCFGFLFFAVLADWTQTLYQINAKLT